MLRKVNFKCSECGSEENSTTENWGEEIPNLCDECMKKGWLRVDSLESKSILNRDKELKNKLNVCSPYYKI